MQYEGQRRRSVAGKSRSFSYLASRPESVLRGRLSIAFPNEYSGGVDSIVVGNTGGMSPSNLAAFAPAHVRQA